MPTLRSLGAVLLFAVAVSAPAADSTSAASTGYVAHDPVNRSDPDGV
jgi:hypothetical protein